MPNAGKTTIKVEEYNLGRWMAEIAGGRGRIEIPEMYQRMFSWDIQNCEVLWLALKNFLDQKKDNAKNNIKDEVIEDYFLGSILISESYKDNVENVNYTVIADGQQRITALSLALAAAFSEYKIRVNKKGKKIAKKSLIEDYERYLFWQESLQDGNQDAVFSSEYPLLKTSSLNEEEYKKILFSGEEGKGLLTQSYKFFLAEAKKLNNEDLARFPSVISFLGAVFITAPTSQLQKIFETANSLGVELEVGELAKNYITMGIDPISAEELYKNFWKKIDATRNQTAESKKVLTKLIYHYLSIPFLTNKDLVKALTTDKKKNSTNPVKENTDSIYRALKAYLNYSITHNKDASLPSNDEKKIFEYQKFSQEILFSERLTAFCNQLQKAEILAKNKDKAPEGFEEIKNLSSRDSKEIDFKWTWTFFQLYRMLSNDPLNRRMTLYWFIQNRNFFIQDQILFNKTFLMIRKFFFRGVILKGNMGSDDEYKLIKALDQALSEGLKAKNQFIPTLELALDEAATNKKKHFNFFDEKINNTLLKNKMIEKMTYLVKKEGQGLIKYFFAAYEDEILLKNGRNNNPNYDEEKLFLTKKDITIEHFYPQNDENWPYFKKQDEEFRKKYCNHLGNLTLLRKSLNSSLQDAGMPLKIRDGINPNVQLNKTIIKMVNPNNIVISNPIDRKTPDYGGLVEWNENFIEQRAGILAEEFIKAFLI